MAIERHPLVGRTGQADGFTPCGESQADDGFIFHLSARPLPVVGYTDPRKSHPAQMPGMEFNQSNRQPQRADISSAQSLQ
jgi:hypothetical protein